MRKKSKKPVSTSNAHSNAAPTPKPNIVVLPDVHAPNRDALEWAVRQFLDERYWSRVLNGVVLPCGVIIPAPSVD